MFILFTDTFSRMMLGGGSIYMGHTTAVATTGFTPWSQTYLGTGVRPMGTGT